MSYRNTRSIIVRLSCKLCPVSQSTRQPNNQIASQTTRQPAKSAGKLAMLQYQKKPIFSSRKSRLEALLRRLLPSFLYSALKDSQHSVFKIAFGGRPRIERQRLGLITSQRDSDYFIPQE